jgi:hypothetical protein
MDYELIFGVSEENLKEMYSVIDGYGENKDIWKLDD